jgi:hypothetical protein
MGVYKLRYPSWRLRPATANGPEIEDLLGRIEWELGNSAVALLFFERAKTAPWGGMAPESDEEKERRAALCTAYVRDDSMDILHANARAEAELNRKRFASDAIPERYTPHWFFMCQRQFVYSLYIVSGLLRALARQVADRDVSRCVRQPIKAFNRIAPDLRAVRDSSAHPEQRTEGYAQTRRGGREEIPGPVRLFEVAVGDDLVSSDPGGHRRVLVSDATLRQAVECVQQVIDVLPWEQVHPREWYF